MRGGIDPERTSIRNGIVGYAPRVGTVEWPAQAEGRIVDQDSSYLSGLNKMGLAMSAVLAYRAATAFEGAGDWKKM